MYRMTKGPVYKEASFTRSEHTGFILRVLERASSLANVRTCTSTSEMTRSGDIRWRAQISGICRTGKLRQTSLWRRKVVFVGQISIVDTSYDVNTENSCPWRARFTPKPALEPVSNESELKVTVNLLERIAVPWTP